MALGCAICPAMALISAMTPETGAASASGSALTRSSALRRFLQLDAGFIELDLRDHAFLRQRLESSDTAFDETDLLVELALPLAHVRYIDGLYGWGHVGENVALVDACAESREPGFGRRKPS